MEIEGNWKEHEAYLELNQTSKMNLFTKYLTVFSYFHEKALHRCSTGF